MTPAALVALILVAGALTAAQGPTNALIARAVGSPVTAALCSFAVGTVVLALAALVTAPRVDFAALRGLPWYAWAGGFYGALFVTVAAFATPRVGVGLTLTLLVGGQLAMALALDHFGVFGLPRQPLTATRLAGVALVVAGAVLVRRG